MIKHMKEKNWVRHLRKTYKIRPGWLVKRIWRFFHNKIVCRRFAKVGQNVNFGTRISVEGVVHVGESTIIESDVIFRGGPVIIGSNTYIGNHSFFNTTEQIIIGNDTYIAAFCYLVDANHGIELGKLIRKQPVVSSPIFIGNDVWLGANVVVLPGAVIEDGAVIGANSVVRGRIPSDAIAVGSPARVVRMRKNENT